MKVRVSVASQEIFWSRNLRIEPTDARRRHRNEMFNSFSSSPALSLLQRSYSSLCPQGLVDRNHVPLKLHGGLRRRNVAYIQRHAVFLGGSTHRRALPPPPPNSRQGSIGDCGLELQPHLGVGIHREHTIIDFCQKSL